jgi:type IV pilus assembly protein PilX
MNSPVAPSGFSPRSRQNGFVLAMSLVFLLLLTIIGITAMNTSSLEEKMAHNVKDKNLSLQATESVLAMAETWLAAPSLSKEQVSNTFIPALASATDSFNKVATPTDQPIWRTLDWNAGSGDFLVYPAVPWGTPTSSALNANFFAAQPRYIIEYVATGQCDKKKLPGESGSYGSPDIPCNALYLTARGVGGTPAAVSMAQSAFNIKVK